MTLSGFEPSSDFSSGDRPDHWWNDPLSYFVALARAGGNIEPLPGLSAPGFLLNHPELIREVLVVRTDSFRRLAQLAEVLRQFEGNSVLVSDGDVWRQKRRIVHRALHSYPLHSLAQLVREFGSPARREDAWDSNQAQNDVLGMLAAGRDTTAAALAWTLYFVALNPTVLARTNRQDPSLQLLSFWCRTPRVHGQGVGKGHPKRGSHDVT
ncbi:MAG: cytochrome P450 [Rhodopirellula sp.]|nr:cytochrome P450 [Rhodopirellula sp.]